MQNLLPVTEAARAAVGRDIACEMASFMRAHPSCTYADLRAEGFTSRQIDRYQPEAKNLADRLSTRRVA